MSLWRSTRLLGSSCAPRKARTPISADGKTVTLELEEVKPVMQMKISFKLVAADASPVNFDIHNTIHVVP